MHKNYAYKEINVITIKEENRVGLVGKLFQIDRCSFSLSA